MEDSRIVALRNADKVFRYQRQRVDEDGYIITENWVNVCEGVEVKSFKEPEQFFQHADGENIVNPTYDKFRKLVREKEA